MERGSRGGRKVEKEGEAGRRREGGKGRHHGEAPPPSSDLVVLRQHHDHQLKGGALAEGHAPFLLLAAPPAALHRVENHLVPAIEAGIEVEGNVRPHLLPRHQVHGEPGGTGSAVPPAPHPLLRTGTSSRKPVHTYPVLTSLTGREEGLGEENDRTPERKGR